MKLRKELYTSFDLLILDVFCVPLVEEGQGRDNNDSRTQAVSCAAESVFYIVLLCVISLLQIPQTLFVVITHTYKAHMILHAHTMFRMILYRHIDRQAGRQADI